MGGIELINFQLQRIDRNEKGDSIASNQVTEDHSQGTNNITRHTHQKKITHYKCFLH